uniref:Uncharacterized protein n=1 Tax=Strigamia maritima TaxID=126957 RepID=T1JAC7_STRMM
MAVPMGSCCGKHQHNFRGYEDMEHINGSRNPLLHMNMRLSILGDGFFVATFLHELIMQELEVQAGARSSVLGSKRRRHRLKPTNSTVKRPIGHYKGDFSVVSWSWSCEVDVERALRNNDAITRSAWTSPLAVGLRRSPLDFAARRWTSPLDKVLKNNRKGGMLPKFFSKLFKVIIDLEKIFEQLIVHT